VSSVPGTADNDQLDRAPQASLGRYWPATWNSVTVVTLARLEGPFISARSSTRSVGI